MDRQKKNRLISSLILGSVLLTGCGEKSECELPTRHVHKYIKSLSNGNAITKYLDSEDLEMLEDMIMVAVNEAMKKIDSETEKKMGKFGNIPGLF